MAKFDHMQPGRAAREQKYRRFKPIPVRLLAPNLITLLALCSGGGGGNGGSNFNSGGGFDDFGDLPVGPSVDPNLIFAIIVGLICLVLLLVIIGVVVRVVTRTALIGMVGQISKVEAVTIKDGWHHGWSSGA